MRLAASYDYVREATIGLGATHLALVTKSAEMNRLGYLHRGKAFRYLQRAIESFSRDNVDAILAASIVLSWQAPDAYAHYISLAWWIELIHDRQTYMCLMDGVSAVGLNIIHIPL